MQFQIYKQASSGNKTTEKIYVNKLDTKGLSAVHYAAITGDTIALKRLIDWGWDPLLRTASLETSFDISVDKHNFEFADIILELGEVIEPRYNDYNALDYSAMQDDTIALHYLLSVGAAPNGTSGLRPPLVWAVQEGSVGAIKTLLQAGADPIFSTDDDPDETAISLAASDGNIKITKLLIGSVEYNNNVRDKLKEASQISKAYGMLETSSLIDDFLKKHKA